jgi:hypothetical protein
LAAAAFVVEVAAFEAEPAAEARSPTRGIANAATASTSTAVKIALFMFIVYPSPKFSAKSPVQQKL